VTDPAKLNKHSKCTFLHYFKPAVDDFLVVLLVLKTPRRQASDALLGVLQIAQTLFKVSLAKVVFAHFGLQRVEFFHF